MTQLLTPLADKSDALTDNICILHVDDDSHDQERLREVMHALNEHVQIKNFSNGLELMQYLSNIPDSTIPPLLFLDLRMPIWDGVRTLNTLRAEQKYSAMTIYMLSAADTRYEVDLCIKLGAKDFITKPVTKSETVLFEEKIRDIIQGITRRSAEVEASFADRD